MANFDMGRAVAGFAQGALTGYKQVLDAKMKEDYENRLEEARLVRAKNLAQWTDTNITDPNRAAEQTFTKEQADAKYQRDLEMQQAGFTHSEKIAGAQMSHAEQMRKLSDAAADARYARENSAEAIKNKTLALYSAQQEVKGKEADNIYTNTFKETKDQAAALMAKNDFIASGMSSIEEYNKYKASVGAKRLENITEMARKPIQDQMEAIRKELTDSPGALIERLGTEYNMKASSPQDAAKKLMELKSAEIYSTSASIIYGQDKSKKANAETTDTTGLVINPNNAQKLVKDMKEGNPDAIELYRKLPPQEKAKIDPLLNNYNPSSFQKANRSLLDRN